MHIVRRIDIKNCAYDFFDNMNNIKKFDPNKTKIDEKSYKNLYIGYVTVKNPSYKKNNIVNPLCL